jgi:outer membrane autotransporter protein
LYGEQVQGWVKGYGSWATQDGSAGFSGYDQSVYGVMIGFDKAYGDYLFGGAGGYASSDISQDDGDSSKSGTGFGMLYSSWGTSSWFADASLAYGLGSVKNNSGTVFDTSAEFDSSQFAYYLGGGKELVFNEDRVFVTPSAGLMGGWYMQDSYTESSSTAVAKNVDAYNHWSLNSEIGAKVAFHKDFMRSVLMPEVHANWIHQFNADEEQVGYSLAGGTGQYSFGMAAPVSDLLELGIGLSLWTDSKGGSVYEWGLGFDSRFGDGYSASALNARLVVEF